MPRAKIGARFVENLHKNPPAEPVEYTDSGLAGFRVRAMPSGSISYAVVYRNLSGKLRRAKIGAHPAMTVGQAQDAARRILAEVHLGGDVVADRQKARRDPGIQTLGAFIQGPYDEIWLSQLRSGTATLKRLLASFKGFLDRPMDSLRVGDLERWRRARRDSGRKESTINRDIGSLKAVLAKAIEWDYLEVHPLAKLKPTKQDRLPIIRYLTDDEEDRLMAALDRRDERIREERDSANAWRRERGYEEMPNLRAVRFVDFLRPLIVSALNSGCRRGELLSMRWEDVDFRLGVLTVHGASAKNRQTRHVPINAILRDVLTEWKRQTNGQGLIFPSPKGGGRMTEFTSSWEQLKRDASLENFRFHDCRHTFASRLAMRGAPLNVIRELLGHSDLKMTLRYSHLSPDTKAEAVRLLELPSNVVPFTGRAQETEATTGEKA